MGGPSREEFAESMNAYTRNEKELHDLRRTPAPTTDTPAPASIHDALVAHYASKDTN